MKESREGGTLPGFRYAGILLIS